MIEKSEILSLFGEGSALKDWEPLLSQFPGLLTTIKNADALPGGFTPDALGFVPQLAVVSSDLYANLGINIIPQLRNEFPHLDIVVLASSNAAHISLGPLVKDGVRHLAVADPVKESEQIKNLLRTLAAGEPWKVSSYLNSESDFSEYHLVDPDQKELIINHIEKMVSGQAPDLMQLRQKGALLADEMIENALQAAPEGALSTHYILVKAGFDGETLALQVIDNWGTLTPEKALESLARHQDGQVCIDTPRGRGLFILWQFFDHFHVNILSGRETAIGGQLNRRSNRDPGRLKGFDIFQCRDSHKSSVLSF